MGFIADDEVEAPKLGQLVLQAFLGRGNHINRLIGRKNHRHARVIAVGAAAKLRHDAVDIGRGRVGQIDDAKQIGIVVALFFDLGNGRIRADTNGVDGHCGIGGPFTERLSE